MLILSRKVGERIEIGDGISLVVKRISGQRVTVGIEAPLGVRVLRGELRPFPPSTKPDAPVAPPNPWTNRMTCVPRPRSDVLAL